MVDFERGQRVPIERFNRAVELSGDPLTWRGGCLDVGSERYCVESIDHYDDTGSKKTLYSLVSSEGVDTEVWLDDLPPNFQIAIADTDKNGSDEIFLKARDESGTGVVMYDLSWKGLGNGVELLEDRPSGGCDNFISWRTEPFVIRAEGDSLLIGRYTEDRDGDSRNDSDFETKYRITPTSVTEKQTSLWSDTVTFGGGSGVEKEVKDIIQSAIDSEPDAVTLRQLQSALAMISEVVKRLESRKSHF